MIQRPDGAFLLAQRPAGKVYAGYWEFPGGKVEPGEPADRALARELHEELGIEIGPAYPWITRVFTYPHGTVRLQFFKVFAWKSEPHPREHQAIAWQQLETPMAAPMPAVYGMTGIIAWLLFTLFLAAIASALPARRASRLTVRDTLAYE